MVLLVGVLAGALEVLAPVYRKVVEGRTLAALHLALYLPVLCFQKVVVLVVVVAETLSRGSHHLALQAFWVNPTIEHSVFGQTRVILLVFFEFPLVHELPAVISDKIAIFDVGVDMLLVILSTETDFLVHWHHFYNLDNR